MNNEGLSILRIFPLRTSTILCRLSVMKHLNIIQFGYVFAVSMIRSFAPLQTMAEECARDMTDYSSWNDPSREEGNWGGFLSNSSCAQLLERYLYVLAKESNRSAGEIFPSITEQKDCLMTLNKTQDDVFSSCDMERLTYGRGGCSDYSVTDVVDKMGTELQALEEHCKNLGSDGECGLCLGVWRRMGGSGNATREESQVCRLTELVSLISRRVDDGGWIQAIYTCLGREVSRVNHDAKRGKKTAFIIGLEAVIGGLGGILLISAIVWLILFKKRARKTTPKVVESCNESLSADYSSVNISLKEVHLATDNLSVSNFIGQGVAGKVYRGVLSNGQRVAVKHIVNDGHMETFVREVTSLSCVKHPNLVELLGHCDGEEESFLVYQLCDNGNLSEWLFGKDKFLTWIQRLGIAIDCAKGLWFLHTYLEGCIVHRDIKPTNILLGANFQAKLSDFGLSKVINKELSYVSSEVRGTFGYVDPEYQKNRHVHSSSDVYSFGVVLLQLLSGQRVINLEVTTPMPLSKMAKNLRKGGDISEFADPRLNGEYSTEAFQLILKLALCCTGIKQQRPSMEKVAAVLQKARRISEKENSLVPSFQSV